LVFALLPIPRGGYVLTEHTDPVEGLLTHLATADCLLTLPHSALACGIVTAWWRFQVEPGTLMPRHFEDEQGPQQQQGRV
jgi:hypothetical protein